MTTSDSRLDAVRGLFFDRNKVYDDTHRLLFRAVFYTGVVFFTLYSAIPIYWILVTALKFPKEIYRQQQTYVPHHLTLGNFQTVISSNFLRYMFNSFVISGIATVAIIVICSFAAYALARLRFRLQGPVMLAVLLVSTFPPIVFVVSMYRIFSSLGWVNTYQGLIVPYTALFAPMAIWILKSFYEQIPAGLEKAARMDGCSRIGALFRVIIPLSAPGVASVAILMFIQTYNEFLFAFVMTQNIKVQPVSIGLYSFQARYSTPWQLVSAASIIIILPVVALILIAQEKIVSGLTAGSLKE